MIPVLPPMKAAHGRHRSPLQAALRRSEPATKTTPQRACERILRALVGEVHGKILRKQRNGASDEGACGIERPSGHRNTGYQYGHGGTGETFKVNIMTLPGRLPWIGPRGPKHVIPCFAQAAS